MPGRTVRHFICDLVLLLGETPLDENIAQLFAQNRTIARKGRLWRRFRVERLSPVFPRPCISLCFICTKQSSSDSRVALEIEHAATF